MSRACIRTRRRCEAPDRKSQPPDIIEKLIEKGYTLLGKVICKDRETLTLCYLKMQNKYGQKVFVYLDCAQPTIGDQEEVYDRQEGMSLPSIVKNRALTCSMEVNGVSFECGPDILCMLRVDGLENVKEETFLHMDDTKKCAVDALNKKGVLLSYPVVKYSEIMSQPEEVLNKTYKVTKKLREDNYRCALQDLALLQKEITRLCCAFNCFNTARETLSQKLSATLSLLEQYNVEYMKLPDCGKGNENHNKVIANIAKRYDIMEDFIRGIKMVANHAECVSVVSKNIEDINLLLQKNIQTMDCVL